ncbi:hypothetical protein GHT06_019094 [Daphnia sinensis]|uniref:ZP domain-containing protein n=1 Tax=Daphnia sinensis TaxID=1820382 RepID=A0AAD5L076_9CRUS|nr:hypothetical protein GHT06_019094 [Daphnia sinensis]
MQGCGTNNEADAGSNLASNVIVIQNDAIVQEIWDSAQKLNCRWTDRVTKTVSVRPLTIDMLEAVDAKFVNADDDAVDVWMDLQQGRWPTSKSIDSAVRIGEQLSLVVGINDPSAEMDLQVRDCYAHSTPELTDPSAFRVQLTDAQGCVMKTKLLGPFNKDRATNGPYAGSLVKWSSVSAFSFPDNMQVFTSCNVEICKGACEPNPCQPESESHSSDGVLLPEAETTTAKSTTLPPVVVLFPTVPPPRTQAPPVTAAVTTVRITTPSYTTPAPPAPPAPTVERTQPPVTTPRYTTPAPTQPPVQDEIQLPSLDYLPPSLDYLPPVPDNYKPASIPVAIETEPDCAFGSKDPRCFSPVQPKSTLPPKIIPPTTTLEPPPPPPSTVLITPYVCQPESGDPRCSSSDAVSQATVAPDSYPSSTIPPSTVPPATIPPIKIAPTTTPAATIPPARIPPITFPPSTTPATIPTTKKVNCYQGSGNSECLDATPKGSELPVSLCPPGSLDPECIFVPGGSNDSPVTSPTTRPTSARVPIDKAAMETKKDGSVDSWKGDPATHAFHMFHFQRGDGRRDRKNKKVKRSADDKEVVIGRAEFAQVRLTRSVRVLPAAMAVEPVSSSFEYLRQPEQSLELNGRTNAFAEQTFCVTTFSLAASAVLIITALLGLITIIVFLAIKYSTAIKILAKLRSSRL